MEHLSQQLLSWYRQHQRRLPWRENKSPYRVWLSEIILQQTRVAQGMPYYLRFLEAFPDVMVLAAVDEQEVLRLWQGLGYYRRARNLHACARQVAYELDGHFPRSAKELQLLPGIGPYTSAAIASIAFEEPLAAVDGNVYRILTRLYGMGEDISSSAGQKRVASRAEELLERNAPGDFNQAMMDLGALICTPKQPKCGVCPFSTVCVAYARGEQQLYPVKKRKVKMRTRFLHYIIFLDRARGTVYLQGRGNQDIWAGLYEFFLIEEGALQGLEVLMAGRDDFPSDLTLLDTSTHRHLLTHQRLYCRFFVVALEGVDAAAQAFFDAHGLRPYDVREVATLPLPILLARRWQAWLQVRVLV